MATSRIDIMIEEKAIEVIRIACRDLIYSNGDAAERGLALLSGIIDIFPSKLFKEIPELEVVYQKLENREVKLK